MIFRVTTLFRILLTKDTSGSTSILLRCNGRPRRRLPIACAAPRPSSVSFAVPHHTSRGSLNGIHLPTLLFTALFFINDGIIVTEKSGFVNQKNGFFAFFVRHRKLSVTTGKTQHFKTVKFLRKFPADQSFPELFDPVPSGQCCHESDKAHMHPSGTLPEACHSPGKSALSFLCIAESD